MTAVANYSLHVAISTAAFLFVYQYLPIINKRVSLQLRPQLAGFAAVRSRTFSGFEILFRSLVESGNPATRPAFRTIGARRVPETRPSWLAQLLRVIPQMGSTSEPPRIKVALAHVEEAVRLLRELARDAGHEPTRECCRVHRLLAAWSWLVKDRRRFVEWRRQDEEYEQRIRERERDRTEEELEAARAALGLPPIVRAGRVEAPREPVYARRRRKGGAT